MGETGECLVLGNPRTDSGGKITGFRAARSVVEGSSLTRPEHSVVNSLFIKCKLVLSSQRRLGNRDQEP